MLSRVDNHGERFDQLFTSMRENGRRNNRNIFQAHTIKAFLNSALNVRQRVKFGVGTPRWEIRIRVNSVKCRDQSIDTAGVTSEFGKVLDGIHHSSASI